MKKFDRREFLGQASCAGLGYLTFMNSLLNLKGINASAISNSSVNGFNDYKAIVCVLLAGGNDSYNMLMPYDSTHHGYYVTARSGLAGSGGLAIPRSQLGNTILNYSPGTEQWALHPSMTAFKDLFNSGRAAMLSNIGTLLKKNTTKADYNSDQFMPIGLFSHSDQIQQWQTGIPDQRLAKGWGGKMADLISDCNTNQSISMNVSLSGSNIFQTGDNTIEYAIGPDGAEGMTGYDPTSNDLFNNLRTQAIDSLIGNTYQDIFKDTYMQVIGDAKNGFLQFQDAIAQSIEFDEDEFPDSYFASQLEMIARTIDVRDILGFKRQIFYITVGGWDHHDEVINNQQGMLGFVSEGLAKFQEVLRATYTDLNGQNQSGVNIEDNVLTMFISEFGRTLTSNGNGSDHAWGGNTCVMGGPNLLNGGVIYGDYPSLQAGANPNLELNLGRYIPTLSTDEYFAEVAKWFGVPNTDLPLIIPNIGEFWTPDSGLPIGFIKNSAV